MTIAVLILELPDPGAAGEGRALGLVSVMVQR